MSIPGGSNPLLLTSAAGAGGGYEISRSLRFNSSDSAYLSRTPASAGNRKTWTYSVWAKRSKFGTYAYLLSTGSDNTGIRFDPSTNKLELFDYPGSYAWQLVTTQVFRDPSAWYHILIALDTTQATASNRLKLYVNGTQVTTFDTSSYPSQNYEGPINNNTSQAIGLGVAGYFDGYLADAIFVDGQALTPSSFTEVSATTGQLIPKQYTGSFGTNGFWLKFSDNSAATATTLGKDYSGNSNNWTCNNLSVSTGSVASPVRFTWNTAGSGWTLSNSNYTATSSLSNTYSRVTTAALDGSTTYRFVLRQSPADGVGGWFFADTTSVSNTHPDELGGNSLGMRVAESTIGTYGTFATANGTSSGQDQITGLSSLSSSSGSTTYSEWVVNMTARKVWVRNFGDSTWLKGGDPSSTSSTPTFSLPSGTVYFGYVGYNGANTISLDTSVPSVAAGNDSLVDTPTSYGTDTGAGGEVRGNYCTWNALAKGSDCTLFNGNLDVAWGSAGSTTQGSATIGMSSGKWYWETTITASSASPTNAVLGITTKPFNDSEYPGYSATSWGYRGSDGQKWTNTSGSSYGASYANGDVVGVAFDADNGTLTFYKNGSSQGTAFTGLTSGPYFPAIGDQSSSQTFSAASNFGQRAFAYTAPSGFKALVDTNIPVVIAKPSTVMDVKLYTGNGSTQTISGLGFSPDFIWTKSRSRIDNNVLHDIVRGRTSNLYSDLAASENTTTTSTADLVSFDANGYTLGTVQQSAMNRSGETYVAWTWDAGSSTVTNTQGSITSQVRANASAGFSIVTYTGNATAGATIGHGLGVTPGMIIIKNRDDGGTYWVTYHSALGGTKALAMNLTDAALTNSLMFNNTNPTSSVFTVGGGGAFSYSNNQSGENHVAYCFAPVAGYSSFGSYVGNGSSDGVFQWCGFRPAWVLIKCSTQATYWNLKDNKRYGYNPTDPVLHPNLSDAESATQGIDFCSNGFKIRTSDGGYNTNGATYVWAAFAESPFQYSRAR